MRRASTLILPFLAAAAIPGLNLRAQNAITTLHAGGGRVSIHESDRTGSVGLFGIGRTVGANRAGRLGGVAALGSADEGFLTLTGSAELHPAPNAVVGPFIGVELGILIEPEFGGPVLGAVAGAVFQPKGGLGVRVTFGWATHGGEMGPRFFSVGVNRGIPRP